MFAWLGLLTIGIQLNAVPLDFLLFRLNQNEIARTLCEHKMPHCNGNCYLMKQLAKSANAESEKRAGRFLLQLSGQYLSSKTGDFSFFSFAKSSGFASFIDNISAGFPTTLDQPPEVA